MKLIKGNQRGHSQMERKRQVWGQLGSCENCRKNNSKINIWRLRVKTWGKETEQPREKHLKSYLLVRFNVPQLNHQSFCQMTTRPPPKGNPVNCFFPFSFIFKTKLPAFKVVILAVQKNTVSRKWWNMDSVCVCACACIQIHTQSSNAFQTKMVCCFYMIVISFCDSVVFQFHFIEPRPFPNNTGQKNKSSMKEIV